MPAFDKIVIQKARPLPVIILADTSGSMDGEKITSLNTALKDMIISLSTQERHQAEIHISLVAFGGSVEEVVPMTPAYNFEHPEKAIFTAGGGTPMGTAFEMARKIVEDKERIPSRAYKPTIVLISDGHPTDVWETKLTELLESERASKATRLAMGIGGDVNMDILKKFINNREIPVIKATDAKDIEKFLQCVTMSVATRSVQTNPNTIEANQVAELFNDNFDNDELDF